MEKIAFLFFTRRDIFYLSVYLSQNIMSFTFGGVDGRCREWAAYSTKVSFLPERHKLIQVKDFLSHPLFGIEPITTVIRDYILGSPLLSIDLFPSRSISINEIYALLYSIACCHHCTMEVLSIVEKCTITGGQVNLVQSSVQSSTGRKIDIVGEGTVWGRIVPVGRGDGPLYSLFDKSNVSFGFIYVLACTFSSRTRRHSSTFVI